MQAFHAQFGNLLDGTLARTVSDGRLLDDARSLHRRRLLGSALAAADLVGSRLLRLNLLGYHLNLLILDQSLQLHASPPKVFLFRRRHDRLLSYLGNIVFELRQIRCDTRPFNLLLLSSLELKRSPTLSLLGHQLLEFLSLVRLLSSRLGCPLLITFRPRLAALHHRVVRALVWHTMSQQSRRRGRLARLRRRATLGSHLRALTARLRPQLMIAVLLHELLTALQNGTLFAVEVGS